MRYICRLDGDTLVADLKEPGLAIVGNRARAAPPAQEALDVSKSYPESV
jgi:hypothetical protein